MLIRPDRPDIFQMSFWTKLQWLRGPRAGSAEEVVARDRRQCGRGGGVGQSSAAAPFAEVVQERGLHGPNPSAAPSTEAAIEAVARARSRHHASAEAGRGATCCASTSHSPSPNRPGPRLPPHTSGQGGRPALRSKGRGPAGLRADSHSGQQWQQKWGNGGGSSPDQLGCLLQKKAGLQLRPAPPRERA
uniref:Uncharacterized protein n=1 Tax=Myotis myotis TaxID=51298 RepID=A0A7J7VYN1_MYOMY|nr:hypothetical protein mMyoMyo1_012285 [Myotis myotis]